MAAPPIKLHYVPAIAAEAAKRFKSRNEPRRRRMTAANKGEYTKVESKERLVNHVNRLLSELASSTAAPDPASAQETLRREAPTLKGLPSPGQVTASDINDRFVERVIGKTRDFLAVQFFDRGARASRAVCRIVTTFPEGEAFGTGFLVTPRLLITNHHVFTDDDVARRSRAEFNYQLGGDETLAVETFAFTPDVFFLNDKGLDFALVAVAPSSAKGTPLDHFGFCPLIGAEGKIITGQPVNIVQHPSGGLKQVVVRDNQLIDLPENGSAVDQYAYYEADTEPGSSGSPVFNDQWEVIALHHSGVPKTNRSGQALDASNKVVPSDGDQTRVEWIANEGIRTSRLVKFIANAGVARGKELKDEFVNISAGQVVRPPPNPPVESTPVTPEPPPSPPPPAPEPVAASPAGTVSITVPLNITISLGAAAGATIVAPAGVLTAPAGSDLLEQARPEPFSTPRPGFDAKFLGFDAPLPRLAPPAAAAVAKLANGGIELTYFHYSVIMNAQRRLAFVSAVNLDTKAKFQVKRDGKDKWYYDSRIPREAQAGPELYADNPLDFGHLTRRQDAAWGADEDEANAANSDTFHLTNCSPQHSVFNQSSLASHNGVLLWGNLEMYVTAQAKKDTPRLSIFNGPVFRATDQLYRGILLPREFWKLIVFTRADGRPGAVAFVLSQESLIRNLPAEEFVVGPYRPFQLRIADLAARTQLDFGKIQSYDRMGDVRQESLMEGARSPVVSIGSFADVVI
ncbi:MULTISPECIES: DNA/RNA non-specific endonuclease [Bradyrhizobium]|jgi:endonuclease G|uniref:DNA/RNA non-specific endonuclease n=1 Tax=Bradyrhizobium TaxID=374 RepID=UPI0003A6D288|nr:DNA/RNA non-specific endonuclease [Bradyrhizobium denitrificans]MCL8483439.1 DNA/RNA non-specific endonuclease [Bradyrhizobium denitrificans]